MLLRTLLIFLRKNSLPKAGLGAVTEISMRVLPVDLDLLLHVNNGVYFSFMDFGRWDMIFRNGVYDRSRKLKWYSVVASEAIKFKKSLKLWDRFTIRTQVVGFDEKYFYISQKFFKEADLMATGLVKIRFLRLAGGTVDPAEVLAQFDVEIDSVPHLGADWQSFESKHLA